MEDKKYYLGLDIGTSSVGFAVTDESYHLIKKQGKHLWGARLFDEAESAKARRLHRSARRRYQRRRERILLLRDLFNEEIAKVDSDFFVRLDNSFYHKEDKKEGIHLNYIVSDDKSFVNKYKSIYHLRQELISSDEKADIRYVYLALAHMIKYRGNFLRKGSLSAGGASASEIKALFDELDADLETLFTSEEDEVKVDTFHLTLKQAEELIKLFKKDLGVTARLDEEKGILDSSKKIPALSTNLFKLMNGGKAALGNFFPRLNEENPEVAKKTISITQDDFEDAILDFGLVDEELALLLKVKEIGDSFTLINTLKGKAHVSDAMVDIYDEYNKDLATLRYVIRKLKDEAFYEEFFGTRTKKGYKGVEVEKLTDKNITYYLFTKTKDIQLFRKRVQHLLDEFKVDSLSSKLKEMIAYLNERLSSEKFMTRQNDKGNGVLPYQLNEEEMRLIIEKQGKYYPFLKEKAKGYPNPDKEDYKLLSLLRYKIPYYVGPLSNKVDTKNHWAVKKVDNVKVTPWNFFDVIDREATAKAFIDNLRNTCTYIKGEPTLPKCSLIFQVYKVLNELNNIQINHRSLTKEEKEALIKNLYFSKKSVKQTDIRKALIDFHKNSKVILSTKRGAEDEDKLSDIIKSNLSSFIDFIDIFGQEFYLDKELFEKAEKVISIITAFEDEDAKKEALSNVLDEVTLSRVIKKCKYKDYAPLSRRLLCDLKTKQVDIATGEIFEKSILDIMLSNSENFMDVYHNPEYGFIDQVNEINEAYLAHQNKGEELSDKDKKKIMLDTLIDESYLSPLLKRSVYQTMHIVDELKGILHIDHFDKIFIECTRSKEESKRKDSRKKQIQEYIAAAKKLSSEISAELTNLETELNDKSDEELRSKRLFHYFMQLGRDVYTGEKIDINLISKNYDIDHIIPQAMIKDDSFNNTVLTLRSKNNSKQDQYPLPYGFISEEGKKWIEVLNHTEAKGLKLMPNSKRAALLRTEELRYDELAGFINRQIVATSQSVKSVIQLLQLLEKTENDNIIYSKAGLVSDFRGVFHLPKVREINDFHHAHDAYLNIVVGDVYNQKFNNRLTKEWIEQLKSEDDQDQTIKTAPKWLFKHKVYARGRHGRVIWTPCEYKKVEGKPDVEIEKDDSTIKLIRKTLSWNDPMVTWMTTHLSGKQGFFNKITLVSAKAASEINFPLKKVPEGATALEVMQKYGAYSDMTTPYYCLVKSIEKKKTIYSLEGIPSIVLATFSSDPVERKKEFIRYFESNGLKDADIILDDVPIKTIVQNPKGDCDAVRLLISGRSDSYIIAYNASELHLSPNSKYYSYLKSISVITGNDLPAAKTKDLTKYQNDYFSECIKEGTHEISKERNLELFRYICSIYKNPEFSSIPTTGVTLAKVHKHICAFSKLTAIDQAVLILKLIKLLSCESVSRINLSQTNSLDSNLSKEDKLPSDIGKIRFNKKLEPGAKLIKTSYTGFYRKVLFEVPKK